MRLSICRRLNQLLQSILLDFNVFLEVVNIFQLFAPVQPGIAKQDDSLNTSNVILRPWKPDIHPKDTEEFIQYVRAVILLLPLFSLSCIIIRLSMIAQSWHYRLDDVDDAVHASTAAAAPNEAAKKAIETAEEAEKQAKLIEQRFQTALKAAQDAQEAKKKFTVADTGRDERSVIRAGSVKQMISDIERRKNLKKATEQADAAEEEVNKQLADLEAAREAYRKAQAAREAALADQLAAEARANEDLRTMSDEERRRRLTKFQQSILDKQSEYEQAAQEAARRMKEAEERQAKARQAQMELMAAKMREAKERELAAKQAEESRKRVRGRWLT